MKWVIYQISNYRLRMACRLPSSKPKTANDMGGDLRQCLWIKRERYVKSASKLSSAHASKVCDSWMTTVIK